MAFNTNLTESSSKHFRHEHTCKPPGPSYSEIHSAGRHQGVRARQAHTPLRTYYSDCRHRCWAVPSGEGNGQLPAVESALKPLQEPRSSETQDLKWKVPDCSYKQCRTCLRTLDLPRWFTTDTRVKVGRCTRTEQNGSKRLSVTLELLFKQTCKQSREVLTMRGHFDWHANSNGRKYLSASMKLVFDFTGGRVLEPGLASP